MLRELSRQIDEYVPVNDQESADRLRMLEAIGTYGEGILFRENALVHFTSSGFLLNEKRTKTLMIHHNIYQSWGWTGGHADGDADLLRVAVKEAKEETGVHTVIPVTTQIAALDVIPVWPHIKRGSFVSGHLHLNVSYLLFADEAETLVSCEGENSGVEWFSLDQMKSVVSEPQMLPIYQKLIARVQ